MSPALAAEDSPYDPDRALQLSQQAIGGSIGEYALQDQYGNTVNLRLHGACHSCPHAMMTLKNGIEAEMRERLGPELTVERVMES